MELNRREFLKLSGTGIGAAVALNLFSAGTVMAAPREFPLKKKVKETTTICCYCAGGCGAIVSAYDGGIIKIEGDPDHPINEGALCPKAQAMSQIYQVNRKPNSRRLSRPLYRARIQPTGKRSPGTGFSMRSQKELSRPEMPTGARRIRTATWLTALKPLPILVARLTTMRSVIS